MRLYASPRFDAHVHFRNAEVPFCQSFFKIVVSSVAEQCRYAVVMPNLPIIDTVERMDKYRDEIMATVRMVEHSSSFEPLMTLYLTAGTSPDDIKRAAELPYFAGFKLFPKGVTTGSENGTADYRELEKVLQIIESTGSRLLIHGESKRNDVYDLCKEEVFIQEDLPIIRQMFSGKIVIEHCSTGEAIEAVKNDENMWGTITPHHLVGTFTETDNPFNRCKPVWQTEENRKKLLDAIRTSNKFFAGTDSAPWPASMKRSPNPPYGCFSSPIAMSCYLSAFKEAFPADTVSTDKLCRLLNNFTYVNAATFYGLDKSFGHISSTNFGDALVITDDVLDISTSEFGYFDEYKRQNDSIVPMQVARLHR